MTEHLDLDDLIDRLTAEHTEEITDEHGMITAMRRPPLLHDLARARVPSIGVGRGGSQQPHQRVSLDIDAVQLLAKIEQRVRGWAIAAGVRPTGNAWPPVDRVLVAWRDLDPDPDPARARKLAGWVQAIEDLLDPPRTSTLPDPCPLCGTAYVDTAEVHGRPLQVHTRTPAERSAITCRACSHVWHGIDGARTLAAQLRGEQASA